MTKNNPTMQDVLTQFYSEYRDSYHPSPVQHNACGVGFCG